MNRNHNWLQSDAVNVPIMEGRVAFFTWTKEQGKTADADGIIDGGECSASETVTINVDDGKQVLPCARNVTATPGGTSANIKAVSVTVYGTDINGMPQTETLPTFTADATTQVVGSKAFRTVTKITVPAMDGAGVTVDLGYGDKYGLPCILNSNPLYLANVDGAVKTATFNKATGVYTTVSFQTAPANKPASLAFVY